MSVERIEKIVAGAVAQRAERRDKDKLYVCLSPGMNVGPITFSSLDQVADYLRSNPQAGVRMNPGWAKVSECVFIDGLPR